MTEPRIAICQHPDGPGEYVPAEHVTNGRCFMECDCTPRVYVALDDLEKWLRDNGYGHFENVLAAYQQASPISHEGPQDG